MTRDYWENNGITNNKWPQLWQEATDTLNDICDYIVTKRRKNWT